jgi:hypothetical protein
MEAKEVVTLGAAKEGMEEDDNIMFGKYICATLYKLKLDNYQL